jgi:protein phosphatase
MLVGAVTDIGVVRTANQDSMFISNDPSLRLFIVADGMGGHKAGELASKLAVESIAGYFSSVSPKITSEVKAQGAVVDSIAMANEEIFNKSTKDSECTGMGTTLTMCYAYKSKLILGHVGDSRAYILRDGGIAQLTEDHSLVNQLIRGGKITRQEAINHPQRNVITRAVGTSEDIEVDTLILKPLKNDVIILCSDGLTNMVGDIELLSIFSDREDLQSACRMAVELAKTNGGTDNITVIAIRI